MNAFVLDTSALLRLYIPDGPLPDALEPALEAAWRREAVLVAPELLLAEAAQVLHRKIKAGLLEIAEADEILHALLDLPLELVSHRKLLPRALELARKKGLTVYDALFLNLSHLRNALLITADHQMLKHAQKQTTE